MEENVLKDFETFEEFPDKYLQVKNKSNYYYIKINDESYITKKNINLVSYDINGNMSIEIGYYDVFNNKLILTTNNDKLDGVKIIPLSVAFNLKENDVYNFTKEDINMLVGFNEENTRYKSYLKQ